MERIKAATATQSIVLLSSNPPPTLSDAQLHKQISKSLALLDTLKNGREVFKKLFPSIMYLHYP